MMNLYRPRSKQTFVLIVHLSLIQKDKNFGNYKNTKKKPFKNSHFRLTVTAKIVAFQSNCVS